MIQYLINNFKKTVQDLKTHKAASLDEWREWTSNGVFLSALILLPVAVLFTLPSFLAENRYDILVFDGMIFIILLIRLTYKWGSHRSWMVIWLILLFIMTTTFFITLGPHYARSAWLLFFTIMAAIFFGGRVGAAAVLINVIMLFSVYFLTGPENEAWVAVHAEPFAKYFMFVINANLIALFPTLLVSFMLARLDQTYGEQLQSMQDLEEKNQQIQQAEKTLKESETRYRTLFESAGDAIFVLKNDTFIECNQKTLGMFGCSRSDIINHSPVEFSPPVQPDGKNSKEKAMEQITNAIKGIPTIFEWQHKKLDGTLFFAEVNLNKVDFVSENLILAIVRDITQRKKMEEMMVQSEKMLSVGGLAAGMAHEINNPLAGIMQTADVMSRRLSQVDMPANIKTAKEIGINMDDINAFMEKRGILHMAGVIRESGQRVAKIVENMLSFARKSNDAVSSHNLAKLLDKILEIAETDYDFKKQYDFKNIKIVKQYEDNLPIIPCEDVKIQQVMLNILRNGSHAMQNAMETDNGYTNPTFILKLSQNPRTNMLCIEIEDNGPGMTEKVCKRIFEPFFTTKPVGEGTGLGLSVSYFIITENHRGTMSVESTPGIGTKFIMNLPVDGKNH